MALFLPPNVEPLAPASDVDSWNDQADIEDSLANAEFFKKPIGLENRNVEVDYVQL